MTLYPQPRERPSKRPRKPQPPPVPRDETGTPFPIPPTLPEDQKNNKIKDSHPDLPDKEDARPPQDTCLSRHPACLRCAVKGMRCSAALEGHQDAVRCSRCQRAGEEFCVRQAEDLTRGEVSGPAWLREVVVNGAGAGADVAVAVAVVDPAGGEGTLEGVERSEYRWVVDPFGVGRDGREVWERECMVYCLDPVLGRDRRRLLGVAADLLHRDGARFVHGTEVSPVHAGKFALPMWHENDAPGNIADPEYSMSLPVDYFDEVKARRRKERAELEIWIGKRKAEETQKAQEAEERPDMEMRAEMETGKKAERIGDQESLEGQGNVDSEL